MLEVAALGSGSSGNALVVRSATTCLLIDCGFSLKETRARMQTLRASLDEVDAILVTHEHSDHLKGVGPVSRKHALCVWTTHGTWQRARDKRFADVKVFHAHDSFSIGDIRIDPFPTPHDAAESCQFVFESGGLRFANVTDLGACTPHVREKLAGVHGLVVECNYDDAMLRNGPYPPMLQARIRSDWGHLGNEQAGTLVAELDHPDLQYVLLGHLSEQNNTDAVARETLCRYLRSGHERVHVLAQHEASPWFRLGERGKQPQPASRAAVSRQQAIAEPA